MQALILTIAIATLPILSTSTFIFSSRQKAAPCCKVSDQIWLGADTVKPSRGGPTAPGYTGAPKIPVPSHPQFHTGAPNPIHASPPIKPKPIRPRMDTIAHRQHQMDPISKSIQR